MPKIRILDKNDFLQSFAVFLMMFLFIAIVCILAALVISYTRCQTIALNNRYIFDDLKRLGASPAFLKKEVRYQCGNVFKIPSIVGMTAIYLLYCMVCKRRKIGIFRNIWIDCMSRHTVSDCNNRTCNLPSAWNIAIILLPYTVNTHTRALSPP